MLSLYAGNYSKYEKQVLYALVHDMITSGVMKLGNCCRGNSCCKCKVKNVCGDLNRLESHLQELTITDQAFTDFIQTHFKESPFIVSI